MMISSEAQDFIFQSERRKHSPFVDAHSWLELATGQIVRG